MSRNYPYTLLWICTEFIPYHETLFNALAGMRSINLKVLTVHNVSKIHPFKEHKNDSYEWKIGNSAQLQFDIFHKVIRERPSIVMLAGYSHPTYLVTLLILLCLRRRFLFWTDAPQPPAIQQTSLGAKRRPFLIRICRWLIWKTIFRFAKAILVTGDPGVRIIQTMGCQTAKVHNFPYWVPINDIHPITKAIIHRHCFSCIGQLIKRKGFDIAIRAFAKACEHGLPKEFILKIAGDGPFRNELEAQCIKLKIRDRVEFLGWLDEKGKQQLLESSRALIHPARWDAYGVVVLEAMERAVPVLGSDHTFAVLDRVRDGVSGLIHPVEDASELANHILLLGTNEVLLDSMSKEARLISEQWPVKRGISIIESILKKISTN